MTASHAAQQRLHSRASADDPSRKARRLSKAHADPAACHSPRLSCAHRAAAGWALPADALGDEFRHRALHLTQVRVAEERP